MFLLHVFLWLEHTHVVPLEQHCFYCIHSQLATTHHAPSRTSECLVHIWHGRTPSTLRTESKTIDAACSVEETASGAVHLHMKPCAGSRASNVREGSIVVLTLSRPPPRGALEWALGGRGRGHHGGTGPPGPAAKKPRCCTIYFV